MHLATLADEERETFWPLTRAIRSPRCRSASSARDVASTRPTRARQPSSTENPKSLTGTARWPGGGAPALRSPCSLPGCWCRQVLDGQRGSASQERTDGLCWPRADASCSRRPRRAGGTSRKRVGGRSADDGDRRTCSRTSGGLPSRAGCPRRRSDFLLFTVYGAILLLSFFV